MMKRITLMIGCFCMLFSTVMVSQTQTRILPVKKVADYKSSENSFHAPSPQQILNMDDDGVSAIPLDAVVLWGGPGDANGEFDGGLNDWTTEGYSQMDTDLDALWKWEADADASEGSFYTGLPAIGSPSAGNGAAVFDSDFLDNNGQGIGNIGMGPAPGPHYSELISPTIDLTGHTDVALNFYSFFRNNSTEVFVAYSNDNGQTWSDRIRLFETTYGNELIAPDTESLIYLWGSGGTSEFKFKFIWEGNYYFWIIDDVAIIERPQNDLRLETFFYTPFSYGQPQGHIDYDEFVFTMDISNPGSVTQTNLQVSAQIFDPAGDMIFEDVLMVDDLPAGTLDSTFTTDNTFLPEGLDVGEYIIIYSVFADSVDQFEQDNIDGTFFAVTSDVFHADTDNVNWEQENRVGADGVWEIGNEYFTGADFLGETYVAHSITFAPWDFSPDASLEGKQALLGLVEVSGDFNPNTSNVGFLEDQSLLLTGFREVDFTNESQGQFITMPLQNGMGMQSDPIILNEATNYFAMVQYPDEMGNIFNSELEMKERPANFIAFAAGGWFGGFTESRDIPVVRLNIGIFNHTDDNPLPESAMSIYPNPVGDQLTANIDLETATKAAITISDVSGLVHQKRDFKNLGSSTLQFDTSDLPNGVHFIRLVTLEGTRTIKFVVQK